MSRIINHIMLTLLIALSSCVAFGSRSELDAVDINMQDKMINIVNRHSLQKNTQTIEVSYGKQLSLNIADEAINRINFNRGRVSKIIGNVSGFTSILSDDGSNLFITPKLPEKSKIDFAVLLSSGEIIDLSLSVVKSKKPYLISLKFSESKEQYNQSEIAALIEAMQKGVIGKYYVQQSASKISHNKFKVTSSDVYQFKNLRGRVLTLQNNSKRSRGNKSSIMEITESDLISAFDGVVGVYIEAKQLARGKKTKAYIVTKEAV